MTDKKNYFEELNKIECKTESKNRLTYVSWTDAWTEVKKVYPESNYIIYENEEGFPFWESKFGIDCKVGVTINNIEHIVRLPVMDGANKSMKSEGYTYKTKFGDKTVAPATTFDINKTIQRAFAKAIAMHGIGLYVFRGEDLPEDSEDVIVESKVKTKKADKVDLPKFTKDNFDKVKGFVDEGKPFTLDMVKKKYTLTDKDIKELSVIGVK